LAILVVGGSAKDIGKTGLVCAIISALREFDWTAIKITAHNYEKPETDNTQLDCNILEETRGGQQTDTGRYLAAGARRSLLITRSGPAVPIDAIQSAIRSDRNVIFESNQIVDVLKPDVCLALIGGEERKPSFDRLLRIADAMVHLRGSSSAILPQGLTRFEVDAVDQIPIELVEWLRKRLATQR